MNDCPRLNKWIGGCYFEARYDLSPADISTFDSLKGVGVGTFLEKLRAKTYVHDICIRCGKTVKRNAEKVHPFVKAAQ